MAAPEKASLHGREPSQYRMNAKDIDLNLQIRIVQFDNRRLLALDLRNKGLTSIPEEVFDITDLEILDVSNNKLTSIPEAIGRLQKLYCLDAIQNKLTSLPNAICSLSRLKWLIVSDNKISSLPPGIELMQELKVLGLDHNCMTQIPPVVCSLSNLEVLGFYNSKLSNLPLGLEKMQKLTCLDLTNNELKQLPLSVGRLTKLRQLYISANQLTELSIVVCSLPNLEILIVDNNNLSTLPPGLGKLQQLTCLYITNNQLKELASSVGKLTKLRQLYISDNQLTELPLSVCSLSNLEMLIVDNNNLSTLPPGLGKMQKLTKVSIRNNQLTEIPAVLFSLPALEVLRISNNQITRLPTTLSQARKLRHLDATGNPLTYPPQNICAKGAEAILAFFKEEAVKDDREKKMLQALNRLSLKVRPTELKPIAQSLGLDKEEIDTIKTSAPDDLRLPDQVYKTLEKWREKKGEAATLLALEQCLSDLGLHQLAAGLLGSPTSPESRTFESEERGAFGGQEATQRQSSRNPSVTVDGKFAIIEFEQLHFPPDSYLGHGGFAAVARAHHRDWKHDVAVKRLKMTQEIEGSEQQLLYSEARKLKLASTSPYVISLLGVCLDPHFAIVMPYMENGSLAGLLRDVDVPWALRWRMAHEISLGMTFLHCQNPQILHCDLKAENVLLDEDFHVKISDFGLWKWTDMRVGGETSPTGATRTHAPPEYYTDVSRPPTDKFDVYSFGVLLWEIVKRNPPFPYAAHGSPAVPTDQRADPAGSDPSDLETVNQLIQACCSHNPDDRPDFKECGDRLSDVTGRYELVHFLKAVIYVQKEKARRK
ncbi:uncharacterized protein LOC144906777 [Branchiostoma floridae x Branchiostoma belcheri]